MLWGFAIPHAAAATLTADADAYVQSGANANTNFGGSGVLQVKSTGSQVDFRRKSYIRFDLGGPTTLASAQLDLMIAPHAGESTAFDWDFNVYGLLDSHSGNTWNESGAGGITWNNAPGNVNDDGAGVLLADVFNGGPIAQFTISGPGTPGDVISLDSAAFPDLLDFLNSDTDGLVTFIMTRTTLGDDGRPNTVHQFHSRESTAGDGPMLTFEEFVPPVIPEPASIAVWALMGLAAAGYVWRSGWQMRQGRD